MTINGERTRIGWDEETPEEESIAPRDLQVGDRIVSFDGTFSWMSEVRKIEKKRISYGSTGAGATKYLYWVTGEYGNRQVSASGRVQIIKREQS